jgi:hypothetical protein
VDRMPHEKDVGETIMNCDVLHAKETFYFDNPDTFPTTDLHSFLLCTTRLVHRFSFCKIYITTLSYGSSQIAPSIILWRVMSGTVVDGNVRMIVLKHLSG